MAVSEWTEVTVEAIAAPIRNALVGGPFGSNLVSRDYVSAGVPVIRGQNMGGRWVSGEFVFVSNDKAVELAPNTARPSDIVFTQRGTLGQVALVPSAPYGRYIVSQSQMKVTVDAQVANSLFVYYVFTMPEQQEHIRRNAIQTGVPHTNLELLRTTRLLLPPLSEQQRIAHVLGTLDDKIELNQRMNETLEAMARALFKSWFVDFDPVRAKAEGRQPVGMDAETAALFPHRFETSELGKIPRGWRLEELAQYIDVLETGSRPKGGAEAEGIPSLGAESIGALGTYDYAKTKYVSSAYFEAMRKGHVAAGDILLYKDGGKPGEHPGKKTMVDCGFPFEQFCINEHVYRVRVRPPLTQHYLYFWLDTPYATEQIIQRAVGVAQPGLNRSAVQSLPVLAATSQPIAAFTERVRPMCDAIFHHAKQVRTLAAIRDAMLPKLLSGEIRVKDAEKVIEEVIA